MIKAILFDFDGVLTIDKTGSQSITTYLAKSSGISLEIIRKNYYKYNNDLLYGKITHKQMWQDFCQDIGKQLDYAMLTDAFKNTKLDLEMIAFLKELKCNYLIGMITDNKCDRIDTILEFNKLRPFFDVISISAEYHLGKEDKPIFEGTYAKLNVFPNECIFIDNIEKNLMIPQKMGVSTILFDDEKRNILKFKKQLENCLS